MIKLDSWGWWLNKCRRLNLNGWIQPQHIIRKLRHRKTSCTTANNYNYRNNFVRGGNISNAPASNQNTQCEWSANNFLISSFWDKGNILIPPMDLIMRVQTKNWPWTHMFSQTSIPSNNCNFQDQDPGSTSISRSRHFQSRISQTLNPLAQNLPNETKVTWAQMPRS